MKALSGLWMHINRLHIKEVNHNSLIDLIQGILNELIQMITRHLIVAIKLIHHLQRINMQST